MNILFRLYGWAWRLAVPFLRRNERLADGMDERLLHVAPQAADLWIQAASAGEAKLADQIIAQITPSERLSILITTNTRQGRDILDAAAAKANQRPNLTVRCAFFPFDHPDLMHRAVRRVRPRLMVLLETEIWPGLLSALKQAGVKVMIINGRLTEKSAGRFQRLPKLCRALKPDRIMAISSIDAKRFADVFNALTVTTMPNIKFDLVRFAQQADLANSPLTPILADHRVIVLGSVRQEEESDVYRLIGFLLDRHPDCVIALCPRHMERIGHWSDTLATAGKRWVLRSRVTGPIDPGSIIVWDTFGELNLAYSLCQCAFVGGSLAPLGGQNFMEPLAFGIRPVIGPHWDNFAWVGGDVIENGLVSQAADWREVGACLSARLEEPDDKDRNRSLAWTYIESRQGGTQMACREIENQLEPVVKQ